MLGGAGYLTNSAVLVLGPPGIGKEALGYYFMRSGGDSGDFCIYITRLPAADVIRDGTAFGWDDSAHRSFWIASEGGDARLDMRDLDGIYRSIREALGKRGKRSVRLVLDIVSPLLVLYPPETVYSFLGKVLDEAKQHDSVLVATVELGMHTEEVVVSLQALFDGYLELRHYGVGMSIIPLLRVGKMRGILPSTGYFRIGFLAGQMTIEHAESALRTEAPVPEKESGASRKVQAEIEKGTALAAVFEYLVASFVEDYVRNRLPAEKSGWRSRGSILESAKVSKSSLYGAEGKYGPLMGELLARGLVETRFFPGERGRGGEIVKLRIAHEKPPVKALVQKSLERDSRE